MHISRYGTSYAYELGTGSHPEKPASWNEVLHYFAQQYARLHPEHPRALVEIEKTVVRSRTEDDFAQGAIAVTAAVSVGDELLFIVNYLLEFRFPVEGETTTVDFGVLPPCATSSTAKHNQPPYISNSTLFGISFEKYSNFNLFSCSKSRLL